MTMTEEQALSALQTAVRALATFYHRHQIIDAVEDFYPEDPETEDCPGCGGIGETATGLPCRQCRPARQYPAPDWAEQYEP